MHYLSESLAPSRRLRQIQLLHLESYFGIVQASLELIWHSAKRYVPNGLLWLTPGGKQIITLPYDQETCRIPTHFTIT